MRLHLRKRGRIWWVEGKEKGVRFRKSTTHTDKVAAELVRRRWERELADPAHHAANTATVHSAAERFMRELHGSAKSKSTVRFYDVKVRHVRGGLGDVRLADLSRDLVLDYIKQREAAGAAQYSVHRELTALRRILKSASWAGEFSGDWKRVLPEYSSGYKPRTRWLTPPEVWSVIHHLPPEHGAVLAFIVATAADRSNCWEAMRSDVGASRVLVRGTKREGRLREVPRVAFLEPFLDYAVKHGNGERGKLFRKWVNLQRGIKRACVRAVVDYFTCIDLRRSVATWLVKIARVPYEHAAKFMGHKSTAMLVKVYGQLATDDVGALINDRFAVAPLWPSMTDSVDK